MKKSIQWQLITIIVGAIFVSFAAFLAIMRYFMVDDYKQFMQTNDLQTAQILSNHIGQTLARPLRREHLIASNPLFMDMPPNQQLALIRQFSLDETSYELFTLLNAEGVETVRVVGGLDSVQLRQRLNKLEEFQHISGVYPSPITGNLIFTLLQRIERDGKLTGTILSDVSLKSIQAFLEDFNEKSTMSAYLLDQHGTAIAQPKFLAFIVEDRRSQGR